MSDYSLMQASERRIGCSAYEAYRKTKKGLDEGPFLYLKLDVNPMDQGELPLISIVFMCPASTGRSPGARPSAPPRRCTAGPKIISSTSKSRRASAARATSWPTPGGQWESNTNERERR
jgi:hypothetical protein